MARMNGVEIGSYLARVRAYPVLSREDEQVLVQRWLASQDEGAKAQLLAAHLRYVVAIALRYRRYGVPVEELVSEGNFGLVHALGKFEPGRGTRFVTYAAYWIRAYVLNHVIRSWSLVGVGSGALRSKMFFRLRRERVKIANLVGDGAQADTMLAQAMGLPEATVQAMVRRLDARDVSLDTKPFEDSSTSLGDLLAAPDRSQEETLAATERDDQVRVAVRSAMKDLDERERYIAEKRLMADRDDELSLAEIGRRLGVSRERARQLEVRTKRKLRRRIEELSRRVGDGLSFDSAA
ncbi:MAG TPA: sigma-70 family RNA polymerase sigma factor [Polyangiaceae bacterium]|nr:sigma-70 family RNA polymerase sigma factor [Polyangiaceae bacterium]